MASEERLTESMVALPGHARLALLVGEHALDVAITSKVSDNSLIWRHINYSAEDKDVMHGLENVIYDNPLLLSDFGETDVLYDTQRFLVVPQERLAESEDADSAMLQKLYPNEDFTAITTEVYGGASITAAVESEVHEFVTRTFPRVRTAHRLAPLVNYHGLRGSHGTANGRMYAHLRHGATDVIALEGGNLMAANTFRTPETTDALYCILAAANNLGFDPAVDRLEVCGNPAMRELLLPHLRKHIPEAMPAIFPSAMLAAGRQAMDTPFELLVLPFIS